MALTACGSENKGSSAPPALTTAGCADAPQLRQRAVEDRRRSDELKSDQERIVVGNRANFHASLAIIADLRCKVTLAEADSVLKPALEAARRAQETSSMYESAIEWGRADFIATQAITLLLRELPASTSK